MTNNRGSERAGPDGATRFSHPDDEPYECRGLDCGGTHGHKIDHVPNRH